VINEEQHVALPKLYGGPAYARPPRPIQEQRRPIDVDDLPIEAFRTDEDLELIQSPPASESGNGHGSGDLVVGGSVGLGGAQVTVGSRPFSLKSLGRFLSGR
jgi:hypothetical protein